jgi:Helix-turn-helix domain of resolvase
MRKAIGTALAGSALAAAASVAAPIANASMHTIASVVYWSGIDCIPVRSPQYPDGRHLGLNTLCGGYSTKTYSAIPGEYIGADPMPFDMSRTVGCEVFIGIGMDASGESAITIAATLGVSRATVYRVLAEEPDRSD